MKKTDVRFLFSLLWLVIGAALVICGLRGLVDDYWSAMGFALLVVGALNFVRGIRYKTDKDYRQDVDVRDSDERTRFISGRAWAWTGYCLVLGGAVMSIVFKLMGNELLMQAAAYLVCAVMVVYWLFFWGLSRKY